MKQGHFYFIKDEFINKYGTGNNLMQNKETINGQAHQRPCFLAFSDAKNPDVFWCVPISSRLEKYHRLYDDKIARQEAQGKLNPKCTTIRFGNVLGQERAFLVQNMFPCIDKYVESTYIDRNTKNEVTVEPEVMKDVVNSAKDVLRMEERGVKLVFTDVKSLYNAMENELQQEKEAIAQEAAPDESNNKTNQEQEESEDPEADSPDEPEGNLDYVKAYGERMAELNADESSAPMPEKELDLDL